MRSKIVLASAISFIFMGCSALMPYHEEFKCQGGSDISICKRVSDVYLESDELVKKNETNTSSVKVENNESCKNNETKELKEMIEAISYNELKNPVEIVVVNECKNIKNKDSYRVDKNNKNKIKPLNKKVKVCVLNANIRKEPNCLSKVVRVAKKNEELFAYYSINDWVKVKSGYIHRSLICGECKEVK